MAPVMFEQIDAEITDEQPKPGAGAAGHAAKSDRNR